MDFIEHLNLWLARNRDALEQAGTVSMTGSAVARRKRSVHIAVHGPARFAELIVWETGEAEFGVGLLTGAQTDEHHHLIDTLELDRLLDRFRCLVTDSLP